MKDEDIFRLVILGEEVLFLADDIAFPVLDEPVFDKLFYELLLGDASFTNKSVDVEVLSTFS